MRFIDRIAFSFFPFKSSCYVVVVSLAAVGRGIQKLMALTMSFKKTTALLFNSAVV